MTPQGPLTLDALAKRATIAAGIIVLLSLVTSWTAATLAGLVLFYALLVFRG